MAPRKVALVADLVRGKPVGAALNILQFTRKRARPSRWPSCIRSAVANATDLSKGQVDVDALYVKTITVDQGPTLRRFMPRAMGRATPHQQEDQPRPRGAQPTRRSRQAEVKEN